MTTARNEHVDDLIDVYALDALEPSDVAIVDEHLRGCERCQVLLAESRRVVAALAWQPEQHEPPPTLRARVLARAAEARPPVAVPTPQPPVPKGWWRELAGGTGSRTPVPLRRAAAGLAVLLVLALVGNTVRLQGQIQQLRQDVTAQGAIAAALRAPGARLVSLTGTDGRGHSQILFNADGKQAYLLTDGLPALPPDKAYQLWLIHGTEALGSTVFRVDGQGNATVTVQAPTQLKAYEAAALTVEPAGGSVNPTTKPFLIGKF